MKAWGGAWSPSPLWGGDFIQHQNPSRLPATLPTRGKVKNAALPHIPYVMALTWWEMPGRQRRLTRHAKFFRF
ncbi:Hypothetical protein NGAL_HAMBI2610_42670 [Neorhizobium galegae bv. orientalis]|nr:Hypothetical protein NGAL_HAMBI2610_42670 [Neorhizobium galegae bv. orientalis]